MIYNLIMAYRKNIFSFKPKRFVSLIKERRSIFITIVICMIILITFYIITVHTLSKFIIFFPLLFIIADKVINRTIINNYYKYISSKVNKLNEVKVLLKYTIVNVDLFNEYSINQLILELENHIANTKSISKLSNNIQMFIQTYIIPIVLFIAGVYSDELKKLSFDDLGKYIIYIVLFILLIMYMWVHMKDIINSIAYSDHEVATNFLYDLRDIKIIFHDELHKSSNINIQH